MAETPDEFVPDWLARIRAREEAEQAEKKAEEARYWAEKKSHNGIPDWLQSLNEDAAPPEEQKPLETKQLESKPLETKPLESIPLETRPLESPGPTIIEPVPFEKGITETIINPSYPEPEAKNEGKGSDKPAAPGEDWLENLKSWQSPEPSDAPDAPENLYTRELTEPVIEFRAIVPDKPEPAIDFQAVIPDEPEPVNAEPDLDLSKIFQPEEEPQEPQNVNTAMLDSTLVGDFNPFELTQTENDDEVTADQDFFKLVSPEEELLPETPRADLEQPGKSNLSDAEPAEKSSFEMPLHFEAAQENQTGAPEAEESPFDYSSLISPEETLTSEAQPEEKASLEEPAQEPASAPVAPSSDFSFPFERPWENPASTPNPDAAPVAASSLAFAQIIGSLEEASEAQKPEEPIFTVEENLRDSLSQDLDELGSSENPIIDDQSQESIADILPSDDAQLKSDDFFTPQNDIPNLSSPENQIFNDQSQAPSAIIQPGDDFQQKEEDLFIPQNDLPQMESQPESGVVTGDESPIQTPAEFTLPDTKLPWDTGFDNQAQQAPVEPEQIEEPSESFSIPVNTQPLEGVIPEPVEPVREEFAPAVEENLFDLSDLEKTLPFLGNATEDVMPEQIGSEDLMPAQPDAMPQSSEDMAEGRDASDMMSGLEEQAVSSEPEANLVEQQPEDLHASVTPQPADAPKMGDNQVAPFLPDDLPEWLTQVKPVEKPVSAPAPRQKASTPRNEAIPDPEKATLPAWLAAMRPVESVEMADIPDAQSGGEDSDEDGQSDGREAGGVSKTQFAAKPSDLAGGLRISSREKTNAALLSVIAANADVAEEPEKSASAGAANSLWRALLALAFVVIALLGGTILKGYGLQPILYPEAVIHTFDSINSIPADKTVLIAGDFEAAFAGEIRLTSQSVIENMMRRDLNIALMAVNPVDSAILADQVTQATSAVPSYNKDSKVIDLGYLPGGALAVHDLANSFIDTVPLTADRQLTANQALLSNVKIMKDFGAVIVVTDKAETARVWVEQLQPLLGDTPLLIIASAQASPLVHPYYQSGQVDGLVSGMAGGLFYERIVGFEGDASRNYTSLQLLSVLMAALIVIGGFVTLVKPKLSGRARK